MQVSEITIRNTIIDTCKALFELQLNKGTSGNVSARLTDGFLITPSGLPVNQMTAESIVKMQFDGTFEKNKKPSSEWKFHLDILKNKKEIDAVIHTHSLYATSLSSLRKDIPAFHYMVAVAGGNDIKCAPYALFGSQQLSDVALKALENRRACLLSNHGMIATGKDLTRALNLTIEVENLAQQYLTALSIGAPHLLTDDEMDAVHLQFKGYGNH